MHYYPTTSQTHEFYHSPPKIGKTSPSFHDHLRKIMSAFAQIHTFHPKIMRTFAQNRTFSPPKPLKTTPPAPKTLILPATRCPSRSSPGFHELHHFHQLNASNELNQHPTPEYTPPSYPRLAVNPMASP